jgi:hypothetical protein
MLKVAIAQSLELDSGDAIKDVLKQCHEQLGEIIPQAGILYTGIDHDFQLILDRINEAYPGIELIGCITDGEISLIHGFADDSICLSLFHSDELCFKSGMVDNISDDTFSKIWKASENARAEMEQEPRLCITLTSSLRVSGDYIMEGFRKGLVDNFPVFGGKAGDLWRITQTYQFYKDQVFKDAATFLLIVGPLLYSSSVESGWIPIGKKVSVTKSENNIIYEIDDTTAFDYYKYYLGEEIMNDEVIVGEYPLAVYEEDGQSFYLRASTIIDKEVGSMIFLGNVPQGSDVQITHSTRTKIIEAAKKSINSSMSDYPGSRPSVALCFSCAARKRVLGTRVGEEYQAYKSNFPELPVIGFYTYGEMGPLSIGKPARFHNETFINLLIGVE